VLPLFRLPRYALRVVEGLGARREMRRGAAAMLGTMQVEGTDLCVVNLGALRIYAKCIQPPCSAHVGPA